jgi:hypothetical protein
MFCFSSFSDLLSIISVLTFHFVNKQVLIKNKDENQVVIQFDENDLF